MMEALAQVAPHRARALVDAGRISQPGEADAIRLACVRALCEDARPEAMAVIESIRAPSQRVRAHLVIDDMIPSADRKARLEQLDRTLLEARSVLPPGDRVLFVGGVAGRYLALGEVDRGTKLLREFLPAAMALADTGWSGYARGAFGEELRRSTWIPALR